MRKTKIVCTLGPASSDPQTLTGLVKAGMDTARLNFSHGDHASHRAVYGAVRRAAAEVGRPVAVLADLCGPKIRLGTLPEDGAALEEGAEVVLLPEGVAPPAGAEICLPHSYPAMAEDLAPGNRVLIDDGQVALEVLRCEGGAVACRVVTGGVVRSRKGINLPGASLSTPALTDKDRADLALARELGVDYLALSFVRSAEDLRQAKALAGEIPVIAKIEKPEAVDELEAILAEADGAMVARGDLGVEIGHEKVPLVQKRIIRLMGQYAKPVITATQMLDSMIRNPSPTRAEVSDVANAVIDGTDAVMLSGETAVGRYPLRAVRVMSSIISEIEGSSLMPPMLGEPEHLERSFSRIIADAACTAADEHGLRAIAVYTASGRTARLVSTYRPRATVIAFSCSQQTLDRLALFWGVHPLLGQPVDDVSAGVAQAQRALLQCELVGPGDGIAVTFGGGPAEARQQTHVLQLWRVEGE